ncbi:MAG: hypothetical protein ACK5BN_14695, partial [Planctomycetota bacterium]
MNAAAVRFAAVVAIAIAAVGSGGGLTAQEPTYPPGMTQPTQEAIERGLEWLARTQASDGSWRNAGGYGSYPAAMTGLAGMALIASGSTP